MTASRPSGARVAWQAPLVQQVRGAPYPERGETLGPEPRGLPRQLRFLLLPLPPLPPLGVVVVVPSGSGLVAAPLAAAGRPLLQALVALRVPHRQVVRPRALGEAVVGVHVAVHVALRVLQGLRVQGGVLAVVRMQGVGLSPLQQPLAVAVVVPVLVRGAPLVVAEGVVVEQLKPHHLLLLPSSSRLAILNNANEYTSLLRLRVCHPFLGSVPIPWSHHAWTPHAAPPCPVGSCPCWQLPSADLTLVLMSPGTTWALSCSAGWFSCTERTLMRVGCPQPWHANNSSPLWAHSLTSQPLCKRPSC